MYLFKFYNKYGKELRCQNTCDKYGTVMACVTGKTEMKWASVSENVPSNVHSGKIQISLHTDAIWSKPMLGVGWGGDILDNWVCKMSSCEQWRLIWVCIECTCPKVHFLTSGLQWLQLLYFSLWNVAYFYHMAHVKQQRVFLRHIQCDHPD